MNLKTKWDNHFDKCTLYSWIFIDGIMKISDEETYKITLKENYVHRTPFYDIDKTKKENKDENI